MMIERQNPQHWDWNRWLWVVLCSAGILLTVPAARSIQKFVYHSIDKIHITYALLFLILSGFFILLFFLVFKLKTRYMTRYVWLAFSCGAYAYFTLRLKKHPEEIAHFIEYGLLSFLVFRALAHRIKDWTIYPTTLLFVTSVGIIDEFMQWLLPSRIWDYKDIGLNTLSAGLLILLMWKVFRPASIRGPVQKISLRTLSWAATIAIIFLGICLSNTPELVTLYTEKFNWLLWLRTEEVMTAHDSLPVSRVWMWLIIVFLIVLIQAVRKQRERIVED